MKALFIGGTGTISAAISRLAIEKGWELWLINRGNRPEAVPKEAKTINCDINNEKEFQEKIAGMSFDVVADFIIFTPEQAERDYRLFKKITKQFIFISSASVYQKPLSAFPITEGTVHANPFWLYSRNKIKCEEFFISKYREEGFPVTIVLPSHTYDERSVPLGVHGSKGSWQVVKRMIDGKPVIIHGDGTSLWTVTANADFAEAFTGLMGNIHSTGESFHITSDEVLTWNQIYQCIANALDVKLNAVHVASEFLSKAAPPYDYTGSLLGDKANSAVFDSTKLKRIVPGWTAKIRFDQGIKKTLDYVLSHKECQREDQEFDEWCNRIITVQENALKEINGNSM